MVYSKEVHRMFQKMMASFLSFLTSGCLKLLTVNIKNDMVTELRSVWKRYILLIYKTIKGLTTQITD